jgi:hypothetical protein
MIIGKVCWSDSCPDYRGLRPAAMLSFEGLPGPAAIHGAGKEPRCGIQGFSTGSQASWQPMAASWNDVAVRHLKLLSTAAACRNMRPLI